MGDSVQSIQEQIRQLDAKLTVISNEKYSMFSDNLKTNQKFRELLLQMDEAEIQNVCSRLPDLIIKMQKNEKKRFNRKNQDNKEGEN